MDADQTFEPIPLPEATVTRQSVREQPLGRAPWRPTAAPKTRLRGRVDDELQGKIIVSLKTSVVETQCAARRVMKRLPTRHRGANVMVEPPCGEHLARMSQPIYQFCEGRVTRPKIVRCTKLRQHGSRHLSPAIAEQLTRPWVSKHEQEKVTFRLRHLTEVAKEFDRRFVPGQQIPSPARDVSWLRKARDDLAHGPRHGLSNKGARYRMTGQGAEMYVLLRVQRERLGERLHGSARWRDIAALLETNVPVGRNAVCAKLRPCLRLETGEARRGGRLSAALAYAAARLGSITEDHLNNEAPVSGRPGSPQVPLKLKEIWALRVRLQLGSRVRGLAQFNLGIDGKLRGCDLVELKFRDVCHGDQVAAPRDRHAAEDAAPDSVPDHAAHTRTLQAWIKQAGIRSTTSLSEPH